MAGSSYSAKQQVRLKAVFTNEVGAKVDPTTVVFKVKDTLGTVTEPAATKDAVGEYHTDITVTEAAGGLGGTWYWRAEGTGAAVAANETFFTVRTSQF
jgi:hypothetical protein